MALYNGITWLANGVRVLKHVVMFSGGVGSWMAAKRVVEKNGTDELYLLFTDTLIEDEDLYRCLPEMAANIGGTFVRLADGRTPWQVFRDERYLGNSRLAPCSHILKQKQARQWVNEHCIADDTTIYLGIDWSEQHRLDGAKRGWEPYNVSAPLCEPPWMTKSMMLDALCEQGITPPRLYAAGWPHNNCGGFCVRAGQQAFAHLLREMPERYQWHEQQEEEMRAFLGKDVSIMADRRGGGPKKPLTMKSFRQRLLGSGQCELDGFGGCGCFLDDGAPNAAEVVIPVLDI